MHVSVLGARVAPVLEAAGVRRLVEIGALRGENTKLILDRLGPDGGTARDRPGPRLRSRRARAAVRGPVRVPPRPQPQRARRPPADGRRARRRRPQLVHGLQRAASCSRRSHAPPARPLPVLVLHDVCWPYGRRDLYYSPETIPDEFRQPYRRAGMRPDRKRLLPFGGGMNPTLCNAEMEGGPRNGVMTALDDFIAEYDKPLRRVVLPIYFGLGDRRRGRAARASARARGRARPARERDRQGRAPRASRKTST